MHELLLQLLEVARVLMGLGLGHLLRVAGLALRTVLRLLLVVLRRPKVLLQLRDSVLRLPLQRPVLRFGPVQLAEESLL